jgi:hypothetical protein
MEIPKRMPDLSKNPAQSQDIEFGTHRFRLDLLRVDEHQTAGWLVTPGDKV